MAHQRSIGTRMDSSGFEEHSLTANLISPKSLERSLSGKDFNRATKLHLVWYEVVYGMLIESYYVQLSESEQIAINKIRHLNSVNTTDNAIALIVADFNSYVDGLFDQSPTASLWISYLKEIEIEIILEFTTSTDRLQWVDQQNAIFDALPAFFAYDQFNYARSGCEMYADMLNLESTHPYEYSILHSHIYKPNLLYIPYIYFFQVYSSKFHQWVACNGRQKN